MQLFRQFRSFFFQLAGALLFLLVSAVVILYAWGYRYEPGPGQMIKTSIIDFAFSLPGGVLFVDGQKTDGGFPQSVKVPPGWYDIRIEKENFWPWEKKVFVEENKVKFFEELYLAPKKIGDDSFLWNVKAGRHEILRIKPGLFALYDLNLLVVYIFDLNRSERRMLQKVFNLKSASSAETAEALASFLPDEFVPPDPISKLTVGKSQQKLFVDKRKLIMSDEDSKNARLLLKLDEDFFEASEDADYFAVFSGEALKIFSLRKWNEVSD